ncbi:cobalamin-5'-phosphate synthase [Sulfitobacter marinus]|uniref:Adenosylcobinamide-GDP ribazoletransferase n=1 Tax=Sulfitobacter marinus TaxID=394264 RepID=A0A1I6SXF6_9RHOB|nr:adenosylcobinamide-GDP ribazoletransferase [Sulfitobacter marinus]SFS81599.1 cobalamin-5'-phosphate synthase [Sulfitobacter marinus]
MTDFAGRLAEIRLAVMMLTRLPVGDLQDPAPSLAEARWAYPLVGLIVGLIAWAIHGLSLWFGASPTLAAVLTLGSMILTTGAMHQDGLADFADGIWGGHDKARRLEIMRDSAIGSYGVLALILCCAVWVSALTQLGGQAGLFSFLAIGMLSRIAMTVCSVTLPLARTDGLGVLSSGTDTKWMLWAGLAFVAVLLLGWQGVIVLIMIALVATLVATIARRRIGGQTGDVLGAVQFICETSAWATLAMLAS